MNKLTGYYSSAGSSNVLLVLVIVVAYFAYTKSQEAANLAQLQVAQATHALDVNNKAAIKFSKRKAKNELGTQAYIQTIEGTTDEEDVNWLNSDIPKHLRSGL